MRPHARSTDPDTSHLAVPDIWTLTRQCLETLRAYEAVGYPMVADWARFETGYDCHQRVSDLRRDGLLERCGRGITHSNKWAYKLRITDKGFAYLNAMRGYDLID